MKIFWSYARRDDTMPLEKVSKLRQAFKSVLSEVLGKDCIIYVDKLSLKWGVKWKKEIDRLIKDSDRFVAIVTPSYFNSKNCMLELQMALAENKIILPIYFRKCKEPKSKFKEDGVEATINKKLNEESLKLHDIEWRDFSALRNEKIDDPRVQKFLDEVAEEIA